MVRRSIRLLDVRPELGRDLTQADFAVARSEIVLPVSSVDGGPVDPEQLAVAARAGGPLLGAVVIDGLLTAQTPADGRSTVSLHGPGDLLLFDGLPRPLPAGPTTVRAVHRSTVALLDDRFPARQTRWPQVAAQLLAETGHQSRRDVPGRDGPVEERLHEVLSSAAARWGWDDGDRVAIDLPLTSELLARVVGGRSATVALGLRELRGRELIRRRDGSWLLPRGAVVAHADELASRFRDSPRPDGVIGEALEGAMAFLGADFGNVQIYDPMGDVLRITIQRGLDQDFLDHFEEVHAGDGAPCGTALGEASQVVVPDVYREPTFAPHREIAEATGIRAIHSTPLVDSGGRLQGMLSTHFRQVHRPAQARLELVRAQAQILADGLSRTASPR